MYPVLFRIGDFEVTSFGALVALGALLGLWLFRRELRYSKLPDDAVDVAIYGLIGGLAGAKLLWVAEHLGEESFLNLVFSRGGLSWFGGLAGGLLVGFGTIRWKRLPLVPVLAAATPALAAGHIVGRIGCFLVGDDYGTPTELSWGIAFPEGLPPTIVPVHPTQLYEAAALVPVVWLLLRMRRRHTDENVVLGSYLILTGVIRFGIEFIRVNERVIGPLSVAHVASLAAAIAGLALIVRSRQSEPIRTVRKSRTR
jgi:phosphatidylglycerol---prolipoprotein diacylglyceryl transferase